MQARENWIAAKFRSQIVKKAFANCFGVKRQRSPLNSHRKEIVSWSCWQHARILIINFNYYSVKSLTTNVEANINGIQIPWIGVDGTSACNNIFTEDGNKAPCPLKQGERYVYRNKFDVLAIYPRIQTVVHWALKAGGGNVACFEVPVRIVWKSHSTMTYHKNSFGNVYNNKFWWFFFLFLFCKILKINPVFVDFSFQNRVFWCDF